MPGNLEEKEKCLEKLNQMQKFLPFLDFMIDKIKKKNNEISLECQLSKFQLLRSMIAEKSKKYNWDVIVKVEDVIEKLITKLDFKEQYEKPSLDKTDRQKAVMATSVVPSSTANSSNSTTESNSGNSVDFIMTTLKRSSEGQSKDRNTELPNPSDTDQSLDVCGKTMDTDLDKDLDGFDLTDCPNTSETSSGVAVAEPGIAVAEKSQDDLLTSSREKLLKSLQSRLFPSKPNRPASSAGDKTDKADESQTASAFSRGQINADERKTKSDCSVDSEIPAVDRSRRKSVETPGKTAGRPIPVTLKSCKPFSLSEKPRTDSASSSGDVNLKQKLKEKLSTDICEVYRVPGKSVGGSLRSLKDSKEHRKSLGAEEEESLKSNRLPEIGGNRRESISRSRSSTEKKDQGHKSHRDSSGSERRRERSSERETHRHGSSSSGKNDGKGSKYSRTNTSRSHKTESTKLERRESRSSKDGKKTPPAKPEKNFDVQKLNDSELSDFVKENVKSLPHLAKLKPEELRKAVQSSIPNRSTSVLDADGISEISDDSFQDPEDDLVQKKVSKNPGNKAEGKGSSEKKSNTKTSNDKVEIVDLADDLDDVSLSDSLNEEEYALKLIEETTIKTYPKKKKGLLELPMPSMVDLCDDVSSVDSFDSSKSRDPRLISSESKNKPNKPVPQTTDKSTKEFSPILCSRLTAGPPKAVNPVMEIPKPQGGTEEVRLNWFGLGPQDGSQPIPCSKPPPRLPHASDPRRHHTYTSTEPKSYGEYKRMKLKEQERALAQLQKFPEVSIVSDTRPPVEGDSAPKQINPKGVRTYEARKKCPNPIPRRPSEQEDGREKSQGEDDERGKKSGDEKRHSVDSEESISPLEELYKNEKKPKTGRGYGLQNFKIPKKVGQRPAQEISKSGERQSSTETEEKNVTESSKPENASDITNKVTKDNSSKRSEKADSSTECTKTDSIIKENVSAGCEAAETKAAVTIPATGTEEELKADSKAEKTDDSQPAPGAKNDAEEQTGTVGEVRAENVKKCEAQVAECDSSMESSSVNEQSFGKESASSGEKSTVVPKEEITQEFVEALIRKSFQSGEGKLLLAQVKLFEEFARKLNSKKLKTIQKIINSESDSSSSMSETSSEDEKKKKKSKKRKKRGRKSKKHKSSSSSPSSSSSESEETSEEDNCDKKEDGSEGKKTESSEVGDGGERLLETSTTSEEGKPKNNESSTTGKIKGKKRRRNVEFGKHFSGRKAKRKQKQKQLLEKILNESPKPEPSAEPAGNSTETTAKESEPKSKPKTKGKCKTELDRLHDDIRSMFISAGVVTATGKRMCRILKQSGGNMNNLDIVKESAKMVEEEKLKKVQTRSSQRNSRLANLGRSESRSRSQSLDKGAKSRESPSEIEQDPKLALEPRVALQKVDLNNFGYGIKISEDCISFRRMQGRNTAIRGAGAPEKIVRKVKKLSPSESIARNVFLARNKRKFERLKESKCKKGYTGKKLMDVVKNLPLKMAKMKHLQFPEAATDADASKKKKNAPGKFYKRTGTVKNEVSKAEISNVELLQYAFEKKRKVYTCKLCPAETRNITMHYKAVHPDHEILISRLSLLEAEKAKLDAKNLSTDATSAEKNPVLGAIKRNMKALLSRSIPYNCRMCRAANIERLNDFANHVSTHTGEFRFQCPVVDCTLQFFSRQDIKFHILTKHTKNRNEFYGKIAELYPLTIEGNQLLGYLCSVCHFVQMNRKNVEEHLTRQHGTSRTAKIIKINMSSQRPKKAKKKPETSGREGKVEDEDSDASDNEKLKPPSEEGNPSGERKLRERGTRKRKLMSEEALCEADSQSNDSSEFPGGKKLILDESAEVKEGKAKGGKKETEVDVEGSENSRDDMLSNDVDMEDCVDLKSISTLKGSDIIDSLENGEMRELRARNNAESSEACVRLKVGPLEAQLFKNSEVLYECYVKGCLFSTRLSNLFERHIEISHITSKWSGICDICLSRGDSKSLGKKPVRVISALRHLKLHEREEINDGRLSPDDLIMRAKLLSQGEGAGDDEEEAESIERKTEASEVKEDQNAQTSAEGSENPYPAKPLLRVRNFLGDRLSTPKAGDGDSGKANEEEKSDTSMFTIENVRSLQKEEEPELKIEQVCSLKDQLPKAAAQLAPGKAIIVRSCPTRKIAIRPEPGAIAVDRPHINVVQPPVVGHPVVLSPISGSSPIRIISAALSPKPKFTVKPIMVPAESFRFGSPNAVPVIRPTSSTAVKTAALIPVTTTAEISGDVTVSPTQTTTGQALQVDLFAPQIASVSSATATPKPTSSDAEEPEEKDSIVPQKMPSCLSSGKKSLKDVKIYQEMLTKTKLCHFFKCMGIECSFTCDDENVFMQHIGLHEVQRRMSRNKGVKTMYLRLANRMTRAFYWQQCAYCCEVLNNSISALSQHIREEHGHCVYQCAFCFYRAVSHSYVKLHQNLAHSQLLKTAPRLIYKCKPLKPAPTLSSALEKHGRRQSVRPYHCDQCGRKFFITEDFISHLASEHQSVTAYTCHICKNLCFKINRLINHYKLHSYSTYQCPYCIHGTETEKEMVFHLCNFHFSQPAVMYVRALAEGQSDEEKQKPTKRKKALSNQLDSLKVIVYESDNLNLDCIVEVDPEDTTASATEASVDISSIVAELGINTDTESGNPGVTPLMKELASIGEKGSKNITVKTLLPNAQFSSESEKGTENCSVLISSGLSIPSDQSDDREMSIPLGQLPLEAVNVQHKEPAPPPPPPPSVESPDRNLKLNELIVNLQHKEKTLALAHSTDEDKIIQPSTVILSSAVHKLPPVVLTRNSSKNLYPSKCVVMKKKPEETVQKSEDVVRVIQITTNDGKEEKQQGESKTDSEMPKTCTQTDSEEPESGDHPRITNVVSLSNSEFDKEEQPPPSDSSIVISEVCSLSETTEKAENPNPGVVINIKSRINSPAILKPPIIRVEDFPIGETTEPAPPSETTENKEPAKPEEEAKNTQESPPSPDVIILEEEKTKDIVTVTLDSDDEKEENAKKDKESETKEEEPEAPAGNETIRKEMELLRKQIANETDSLLLDEPETGKPEQNLTLNIKPPESEEVENEKTLLSPIEEAICSLNRKLQSETEQKKEEEEKEKVKESRKRDEEEEEENKVQERPRTRFGARDRKKETGDVAEKSDGDDGKKEDPGKKRFSEELSGKELFVCGNEKCSFAADDDSTLKDHLFVCDLSRESSVLVCPHCSRPIKQFHAYLEHLKYHGEKKFHCGLCSFSSAVDQGASRHVKQKHKCSIIKILPKESQEGHLVYYPKNYKVDKVDFEVNGYSPGDEDKLPLQSVYQVNVKCAKCPYFTKVRSNMVRHLKIHVKSVETEGVVVVPSTAPTNPVPCLETKERMFDKMTNLAASSQLAQAKEKAAVESLSPEEEAKLPQFVPEQMRYKCCLPDCNYITVDDGMLKHHIKALHDEISYYSCPHCQSTVHADVRHVTLDKIGFHLKHHDAKLYKCAHCIFFHYQKNVVEKHTVDKHPDRRYFMHTVREPKPETAPEEECPATETGTRVWKCGLCDSFQTPSKPTLMDHLMKTHNTRSKYKCQFCSLKGNAHQLFAGHFASRHPGEKLSYVKVYYSEIVPMNSLETQSGNSSGADSSNEHFDTTPLWQRGAPRVRHIRGILIEEEEIKTKKTKRASVDESDGETSESSKVKDNAFYCPLCTNKKKPFYTRSEEYFRTHLYQELNYQQFACILCGKMFVDKKDFERHHSKVHPDKEQVLKQTKEDHEIKFWVDRVIAKRRQEMEERKRKLSDGEEDEGQAPPKKPKEV